MSMLGAVLKCLSAAGLRVRKGKMCFPSPSVVYLGHKIDREGLHPVPEKVKAVQGAPRPTNVPELKSYLGLLSYYSKFLPNLSTVMAPPIQAFAKEASMDLGKSPRNSVC